MDGHHCPACGAAAIPGDENCDVCGYSLSDLSLPRPRSAAEQGIWKDRIRTLAPRRAVVVPPDTPVATVLQRLSQLRIGCVIVADGDRLLGIFSERDALMRLNTRFADLADRPISEFMTQAVETLTLDDRIAFALHKMDLGGFRHILIVDEHSVRGVISVRDLLRYLNDRMLQPAAQ